MMTAAILAGGLATRLRPITETIPKALVEINGEPFLAHQLRLLRKQGISQAVICAGYRGRQIEEFAGDGSRFGLTVEYSYDGPQLLGTAGALKKAMPMLGEAFFVIYGDSYLTCNHRAVQDFFLASGKLGLMTVYRNEGLYDTSNVEFEDGRIVVYDKRRLSSGMRHIDYGLGAFHARAFDAISLESPTDLAALYQELLSRGELAAYEASERFFEIGSPSGIEELSLHLTAHRHASGGEQQ